jgi:hypothetical protein
LLARLPQAERQQRRQGLAARIGEIEALGRHHRRFPQTADADAGHFQIIEDAGLLQVQANPVSVWLEQPIETS